MASSLAMQRRIYEILTNPRPGDMVGRAISLALLVLIAASVTTSVLESDPEIAASAPRFFHWFEWCTVVIFTVELVLRMWSCVVDPRFAGNRLRMLVTPMALVDLISIAPFFIALALPGVVDLRFLRVLRLIRLFRFFRVARIANAFTTVIRVLQDKRAELGVAFAVVVVAMMVAAGAIFIAEHDEPGTLFTSIPRAMWWSIETVTTIGYGDMVPTSPAGKVIAGFVGFAGICAVALPVGIISSGFVEEVNRKKQQATTAPARCPHCGGGLDA